ncbi:4Fe-4S dicluster domain-containing protein [Candidatus Bathyarchaeota archaeon]|nr:4Fe-4S dicluster domain-containing protein [Candidatus Bathyarchaeota archaeon]
MGRSLQVGDKVVLERQHLQQLLDVLSKRGYRILGPTVRDQAIVYDEVRSLEDLPAGWTDEQNAGTYRLKKRADNALFGYVVGPHSWKKFLLQPDVRLWQAKSDETGLKAVESKEETSRSAFIGVRSCELHAIAVQDKVFMAGDYVDPSYKSRRENLFVVAVNCVQAGGTCFCTSMKTGPKATFGFDLAITELANTERHYLVAEAGTETGVAVLGEVTHREASEEEKAAAEGAVEECSRQMGRTLSTAGIKELLYRNYENPRWEDVASRCLTCGNCTMVCPTCFCTTVEDYTDLSGQLAERRRRMDVCFTMDFSYIHGGSIRYSPKARYRQWMAHKLATWVDQFGVSGCVGCGRCITWCPVAIDITEEARAIRESESSHKSVT